MSQSESDRKKVMIVNDSLHARSFLGDLVKSSGKLELAGVARDGVEAMERLLKVRPDVVLLDLEMPNMDGFTFIEKAMKQSPLPIIVCSSYGGDGGSEIVFESLEAGAIDFIPLDDNIIGNREMLNDILIKIELACNSNTSGIGENPHSAKCLLKENRKKKFYPSDKIVVIGSSTGGPRVLSQIFGQLPSELSAGILVIQHMPKGFTSSLAKHLDQISRMSVSEAVDGAEITAGSALVAPSDFHVTLSKSLKVKLNSGPKKHGVRPSINVSMISASEVFGPKTIGVLLSGMGQDGAFGSVMIRRRGGKTIGQDEKSSIIYGMAKAANDLNGIDEFAPAELIADKIGRFVEAG